MLEASSLCRVHTQRQEKRGKRQWKKGEKCKQRDISLMTANIIRMLGKKMRHWGRGRQTDRVMSRILKRRGRVGKGTNGGDGNKNYRASGAHSGGVSDNNRIIMIDHRAGWKAGVRGRGR
jgi:hypothetical protein